MLPCCGQRQTGIDDPYGWCHISEPSKVGRWDHTTAQSHRLRIPTRCTKWYLLAERGARQYTVLPAYYFDISSDLEECSKRAPNPGNLTGTRLVPIAWADLHHAYKPFLGFYPWLSDCLGAWNFSWSVHAAQASVLWQYDASGSGDASCRHHARNRACISTVKTQFHHLEAFRSARNTRSKSASCEMEVPVTQPSMTWGTHCTAGATHHHRFVTAWRGVICSPGPSVVVSSLSQLTSPKTLPTKYSQYDKGPRRGGIRVPSIWPYHQTIDGPCIQPPSACSSVLADDP